MKYIIKKVHYRFIYQPNKYKWVVLVRVQWPLILCGRLIAYRETVKALFVRVLNYFFLFLNTSYCIYFVIFIRAMIYARQYYTNSVYKLMWHEEIDCVKQSWTTYIKNITIITFQSISSYHISLYELIYKRIFLALLLLFVL